MSTKNNDSVETLFNIKDLDVDTQLMKTHQECAAKSKNYKAYRYALVGLASSDDMKNAFFWLGLAAELDPVWEPLRKKYAQIFSQILDDSVQARIDQV
jgi:hypothetical protein